jgi:hypothetical protein
MIRFGNSLSQEHLIFIFCFVSVAIILLTACTLTLTPTSTPTITPMVSVDKAIQIAIEGCKIPHLVLIGEPQNIRTKLSTLEEADRLAQTEGETSSNFGIPMDSQVWQVQLDGQLQIVGGPPTESLNDSQLPTSTPPKPFWGTCTAVVNATTGSIIFVHN